MLYTRTSILSQFLRLLSEEMGDSSSEMSDLELALSKAVDATALSMEEDSESSKFNKEKHREYEHQCREKFSTAEVQSDFESADVNLVPETDSNMIDSPDVHHGLMSKMEEKPIEDETMLNYQRKVTVLYVLFSACLADARDDKTKCSRRRKGYDARHRVTLRLLATWLDIKWSKMVCVHNFSILCWLFECG